MPQIQVVTVNDSVRPPMKSTFYAACYDVFANEIIYDPLDESVVEVKLGFSLIMPTEYKVVLVPRSSLTRTSWIVQNSPGQGDADYKGEYKFVFRCIPVNVIDNKLIYEKFPYNVGDRCGQIYFERVREVNLVTINASQSELLTRKGGFGSTGK